MDSFIKRFGLISLALFILCSFSTAVFASSFDGLFGEDIATAQDADRQAIYRLYNPHNSEHLYTTDNGEVNNLKNNGWRYEGIGWYAPLSGTPILRLYQPQQGNHLYTSDQNEIAVLLSQHGWVPDNAGNPVFYSGGGVPIYRAFTTRAGGLHHYTTDPNEYNSLPGQGWQQEGVQMSAVQTGELIAWPNEEQAALDLQQVQREFPKGTYWGDNSGYTCTAFCPWRMSGCDGFALLVSDRLFAGRPGQKHLYKSAIRIGDLIRYHDETTGGHSVIVMSKSGSIVTVAEGNWSSKVNYGRQLNIDKPTFGLEYIWTRYP